MRRCILSILTILFLAVCANAQKITDSGYRTVGQIKTDGTIQDASYMTLGHAKDHRNLNQTMEW